MPKKSKDLPILARVEKSDGTTVHQRFYTIKSARHWVKGMAGGHVRRALIDGQVVYDGAPAHV
jgi:hypothetical protein